MMKNKREWVKKVLLSKHKGISEIMVTVGLAIIALLLCVVMKDSMSTLISTIVGLLSTEAKNILTGVASGTIL